MKATGYAVRYSELRTAGALPAEFHELTPDDLSAIQAVSDQEVREYRAALEQPFESVYPYGI